MLKIKVIDNEIFHIDNSKVEINDIYPSFCCEGFNWEVSFMLETIWGVCGNPECTNGIDGDGLSNHLIDDIYEYLFPL